MCFLQQRCLWLFHKHSSDHLCPQGAQDDISQCGNQDSKLQRWVFTSDAPFHLLKIFFSVLWFQGTAVAINSMYWDHSQPLGQTGTNWLLSILVCPPQLNSCLKTACWKHPRDKWASNWFQRLVWEGTRWSEPRYTWIFIYLYTKMYKFIYIYPLSSKGRYLG